MNCGGIRGEENVLKMQCVKDVVRNAKLEGLKIMIGGDMNAHGNSMNVRIRMENF